MAVTGANGFVGSRVVRALRAAGHEVLALVGADRDAGPLEGLDVEQRPLDLLDERSVRAALAGGAALVHTAACYSFWERDRRSIYRANVEGTDRVLRAARELGYARAVYTSSTATLSPQWREADGADGLGDERGVFDLSRGFQGHYKCAKVMAEIAALRHAAEGFPVVLVHPTAVIGEGDRKPTPSGSMIVHFLNRRMKAYADTWLNIVDVDDVAEGHRLALERGAPGGRYILGGENLPMRRIVEILSELTGIPPARFAVPSPVLMAVARASEWVADHLTHRAPTVEIESVLHARTGIPVSTARAEKELGYRASAARPTLAKAARWFVAQGHCRPADAAMLRERLGPAAS